MRWWRYGGPRWKSFSETMQVISLAQEHPENIPRIDGEDVEEAEGQPSAMSTKSIDNVHDLADGRLAPTKTK